LIIPGMTHLRKAQPVLLAHHLLAYVEMLEEDRMRLLDAGKRVNILPLGSGALAGSGLAIDQKFLARELGFAKITSNSLQAVSDRGFITEILSILSILWMHLSRLSEDFILWNSEPFQYIDLDDAFSTGSSLMPHKKNPDVFELIRGRSAVIFGYLQTLLTLQKGLPLAYNRDLQEDKPALFDALRKTGSALEVLSLTVGSITFNKGAIQSSCEDEGLFATDLLEHLVKRKVSFREAHETVGRLVRESLESQKSLRDFSLQEIKKYSKSFDQEIFDLLNSAVSVRSKKTAGSTHPTLVKKEIRRWKHELK
ncbi:MAG TPA: argininosuccinate lyase, partial [bacterium]|nr:argininosuccinate lyase [bacterium]